jgi:hypothetical protein
MNRLITAFVAAGVLALASGCGTSPGIDRQRLQYTTAILDVYQKIDDSYAKCEEEQRQEQQKWWQMGVPGVFRRHFDRISSIDTSRCPTEFQQAFNEYLFATKDLTETIESTQGWGAWFANYVTLGGASLIPAFVNQHELGKNVRDAQFKMKRIAMQYDITFGSEENTGQ